VGVGEAVNSVKLVYEDEAFMVHQSLTFREFVSVWKPCPVAVRGKSFEGARLGAWMFSQYGRGISDLRERGRERVRYSDIRMFERCPRQYAETRRVLPGG
jgi:hypothetical protein